MAAGRVSLRRAPRARGTGLRCAPALAVAGSLLLTGCGGGDREAPAGPAADPLLTQDVPRVVRNDCRRAARKMSSGAVYCPPLVPRGRTRSQNRSSRGRVSIDARGESYTLNFLSSEASGFDRSQPSGARRHVGHWLIAAQESPGRLAKGPGTRVLERTEIAGVPVTFVARRWVAYHLDAGHTLAIWPFAGRTYEVSLHGFESHRALRLMARALVEEMSRCPPGGEEIGRAPCNLVYEAGSEPLSRG